MKLFKNFFVLGLFFSLLFLTSCGKSKDEDTSQASNTATMEESTDGDENSGDTEIGSQAFTDKYNAYIDYYNHYNDRMNDAYEMYYRKGLDFTPSEKDIPVVYTSPENYAENLNEVLNAQPSFGTDESAKEMMATGQEINAILKELNGYYDRKDYKSDNFKMGLEAHAKLKTLWPKYFEQYKKVRVQFNSIEDQMTEKDLKQFKKDGRMISYNLLLSVSKADQMMQMLEGVDGPDLAKINVQELEKKLAEFRAPFDEVLKEKDNQEQIQKEFKMSGSTWLSQFIRYGNNLIADIRDIEDRIEKKDFEFSITHPQIPDEGSSLKAFKDYSDMINNYNNLMR